MNNETPQWLLDAEDPEVLAKIEDGEAQARSAPYAHRAMMDPVARVPADQRLKPSKKGQKIADDTVASGSGDDTPASTPKDE